MNVEGQSAGYVVLGDVVDSRSLDNREQFRETLASALDTVTDRYEPVVDVPFEMIKGVDEFGGILSGLGPLYELLTDVLNEIHPTMIRIGVASGDIDVRGERGVADMDGGAFHRADRLVSEGKANDMYANFDTHNADSVDALATNNINLLLRRRSELTSKQVEILTAYEAHGTQEAAAAQLDVSQQSVSKTLRRIDYQWTRHVRTQLREALEAEYGG